MRGLTTVRLRPDPGAAASSGHEITVDTLAGDSPSLVFLHGMTSTRSGVKGERILARARARGLGFARFDFRGHGDSDGAIDGLTMTDLISDIQSVVDLVGRCILIGSSMGGLAGAWFAATRPEQVDALVLLSPALGYLPRMAQQDATFELRRGDDSSMILRSKVLEDARRFDEAKLPGAIRVPVFVVHGTADRTVPPELSAAFCAALPHAEKELWLIENGSHSLNEDIDEILFRMDSFLEARALIPGSRNDLFPNDLKSGD